MLLMSADRAQEYAEFSPATGTLEYFTAVRAEQSELQARISGRYAVVDQTLVLLYREDALLKLRLRGQTYEVHEDIFAEYKRLASATLIEQVPSNKLQKYLSQLLNIKNTFRLLSDRKVILTFNYAMPLRQSHVFDPTPFIEDEDFDFMLFVHNVINSTDRRNIIWIDST